MPRLVTCWLEETSTDSITGRARWNSANKSKLHATTFEYYVSVFSQPDHVPSNTTSSCRFLSLTSSHMRMKLDQVLSLDGPMTERLHRGCKEVGASAMGGFHVESSDDEDEEQRASEIRAKSEEVVAQVLRLVTSSEGGTLRPYKTLTAPEAHERVQAATANAAEAMFQRIGVGNPQAFQSIMQKMSTPSSSSLKIPPM